MKRFSVIILGDAGRVEYQISAPTETIAASMARSKYRTSYPKVMIQDWVVFPVIGATV